MMVHCVRVAVAPAASGNKCQSSIGGFNMPRKMDFETKYRAGEAKPFDQKNEMFKRQHWDKKFEDRPGRFFSGVRADGRNGATNENLALANAVWSIERRYANGCRGGQQLMLDWSDDCLIRGLVPIDKDTPYDATDAAHNTRVIKKAAKFVGAAATGICRLDRRWIYSKGYRLKECVEFDIDVPDECAWVINMVVEMPYEHVRYMPTFLGSSATGIGYSRMAIIAGMMAQFIRQLGYKALPCGNDTAMSVPYAIQAGLGEVGRNGILITPEYGPRVRLCKVFTNLPLVCDEPVEFGVAEFCNTCKQCATECPSNAMSQGERTTEGPNISNSSGPLKWYVDGEKCHEFWIKSQTDCGVCIRVCPFTKPRGRLHAAARWIIERFPRLNSLMLKADNLCGYDKKKSIDTYWDKE